MKRTLSLIIIILSIGNFSFSQSHKAALIQNRIFEGTVATQKIHLAIYQLDSNDPKTIEKTILNINNALHVPRLKGKHEIELVAFNGGREAYLKVVST